MPSYVAAQFHIEFALIYYANATIHAIHVGMSTNKFAPTEITMKLQAYGFQDAKVGIASILHSFTSIKNINSQNGSEWNDAG